MATLSLTIFKAKALKDGRHKIRIALRHKHETTYIVTRFIISENQFKNGNVIFSYIIQKGKATSRNAIKLLEIIGYDKNIINKAEQRAERFIETGVWRN
jgi:DNA mismatch repair ATPase MutS